MPGRRLYLDVHLPRMGRRKKLCLLLAALLAAFGFVAVKSVVYLRELSCQMVLSDATDLMTLCINDTVARKLGAEDYGYDYFVDLDYAPDGRVTAVRANMARINAMSSEAPERHCPRRGRRPALSGHTHRQHTWLQPPFGQGAGDTRGYNDALKLARRL